MPDNSLVMEFLERVVAGGAAAVAGLSTALGDRLGPVLGNGRSRAFHVGPTGGVAPA
jgi:hypothetical protein